MNETFKMDNIIIELDEDGYLVNSSNPNLIKRLEEEFEELRVDGDTSDLYYQTKDSTKYFEFYSEGNGIRVNIFSTDKLTRQERGFIVCTMYPIDTLIHELEKE